MPSGSAAGSSGARRVTRPTSSSASGARRPRTTPRTWPACAATPNRRCRAREAGTGRPCTTPATRCPAEPMTATFIGVRHHSPACARLVRDTIRTLRPAHVLVEGPCDMNDRMDEVGLDHLLPVAIFTSYRDTVRHHASWSPLCAHSPEWVALTEGRAAGAEVRFIDLPAWHPAFALRANRYSDAERRHSEAIERLCSVYALDNVDTLWDHVVEIEPEAALAEGLTAYFDLIRGDAEASDQDTEREEHMAGWVRAALADAGDRPVVVVTGGFHRPALVARLAGGAAAGGSAWPDVPTFPDGAVGGSYLVPFSFKRLDAFDGYQ